MDNAFRSRFSINKIIFCYLTRRIKKTYLRKSDRPNNTILKHVTYLFVILETLLTAVVEYSTNPDQ